MNRTRDYYRKQRAKHITRKRRMIKEWSYDKEHSYWVVPAGTLSKGKIHCSCWICRHKSYDHKAAKDLARIEAMKQSEEYFYDPHGYDQEVDDSELLKSEDSYHWVEIDDEYWDYGKDNYDRWFNRHLSGFYYHYDWVARKWKRKFDFF